MGSELTQAEKHLPEMETMLNVVFAGHLQIVLVEAELRLILHPVDLLLKQPTNTVFDNWGHHQRRM